MHQGAAILLALLIASSVGTIPAARAGHEVSVAPSFYPHEIRVETTDPAAAAGLLQRGTLHAFTGEDPFRGKTVPQDVSSVEFLGSYVVATLDGPSTARASRDARCALAARILNVLSRSAGAYVFHPYPVTPFHADYLYHYDLIESLKRRYVGRPAEEGAVAGQGLRLRVKGGFAERLVGTAWRATASGWDATIEEVDAGALQSARATRLDGWWGPPWLKEGWFQAYVLLAERIGNKTGAQSAEATVQRLMKGQYRGLEEKLNLERQLVALLTHGCDAVVVGYTTKREYFNASFSKGVENIAFDSQTGLNSPIFIRTVKLKDFPWNGWLRLGIPDRPGAAWNPVGGFTDAFGRLVWAAMGDPALLPAPYGAGWIVNRVIPGAPEEPGFLARLRSWLGGENVIAVPRDALRPEPGTGLLRRVGPGKTAGSKIVYSVLVSSFHDGTQMGLADVLYPYVLAYRWGGARGRNGVEHDGTVEASTALLREDLVGFRLARVDQKIIRLGDITLAWQNPVVEVYLNASATDRQQIASVASPWASVPWHVMALMEEAVRRRIAAFSEDEARRRGVEWLDLVRRPPMNDRLATLAAEFAVRGYVPEALKAFVTADEARQRWRALNRFHQKYGHFLVTNGPYRLERWTEETATLSAFRDLSYPLGIGSFDAYPIPRRGYISSMEIADGRLHIRAEVERVEKYSREYTVVREPLTDSLLTGWLKVRPECRYVTIGSDGQVIMAGTAAYAGGGIFAVERRRLGKDPSAILAAIYVDESDMAPEVRVLRDGRR